MNPEYIAFSIVIMLFSVIVHEVMHGWVALKFGDTTALRAGRLTLNPIPHIDMFGTILLPAILILSGSPILFGWAKPVPVNPLNFSNLRKGELFVSAAGVLSNFAIAVTAAILFHIFSAIDSTPFLVLALLRFTIMINLALGVFNLFPIPPLDGSKVLMSQLPYNLAKSYSRLEPYGFLILIILFLIPVGNTNLVHATMGFLVNLLSGLLGL